LYKYINIILRAGILLSPW